MLTDSIGDISRHFCNLLLGFFLPKACVGCGEGGSHFCPSCLAATTTPSTFFCPGCLKSSFQGLPCATCASINPVARLLVAGAYQQPSLRRAIEAFKYQGVCDLAAPLGELLVRYLLHLKHAGMFWTDFSCVIPVPLHRRRLLSRGYNQAELLAFELHKHFGWPVETGKISRDRATVPQVGLPAVRRFLNMRTAFRVHGTLRGADVLLLDDVVTTGATFSECAAVLRDAGTRSVTALALAHG